MSATLQPARHEFLLPLPSKVRTALRKRGRKEGLPAAAIARRVLNGDGASKAATANASGPAGGIEIALDIPPDRFTPKQLGGLLDAADARGITVEAFMEGAITAKLGGSPDAPPPPPGPALDFDLSPYLSQSELAAFHALCRHQGKAPEDVLTAVIRRGLVT